MRFTRKFFKTSWSTLNPSPLWQLRLKTMWKWLQPFYNENPPCPYTRLLTPGICSRREVAAMTGGCAPAVLNTTPAQMVFLKHFHPALYLMINLTNFTHTKIRVNTWHWSQRKNRKKKDSTICYLSILHLQKLSKRGVGSPTPEDSPPGCGSHYCTSLPSTQKAWVHPPFNNTEAKSALTKALTTGNEFSISGQTGKKKNGFFLK